MTSLTTKKDWRHTFLDALNTHGVITQAAKEAGVSRQTVYFERRNNQWFADEWEKALERGVDALEDAAKIRAFEGSDTLLIFLLKSRRREIYGERPAPVLNVTPEQLSEMDDQALDAFIAKLARASTR